MNLWSTQRLKHQSNQKFSSRMLLQIVWFEKAATLILKLYDEKFDESSMMTLKIEKLKHLREWNPWLSITWNPLLTVIDNVIRKITVQRSEIEFIWNKVLQSYSVPILLKRKFESLTSRKESRNLLRNHQITLLTALNHLKFQLLYENLQMNQSPLVRQDDQF